MLALTLTLPVHHKRVIGEIVKKYSASESSFSAVSKRNLATTFLILVDAYFAALFKLYAIVQTQFQEFYIFE